MERFLKSQNDALMVIHLNILFYFKAPGFKNGEHEVRDEFYRWVTRNLETGYFRLWGETSDLTSSKPDHQDMGYSRNTWV